MDGNGHYWPGQPPALPPGYYPTPADPLVSPSYEGWWQRVIALARMTWKQVLAVHLIVLVPTTALTLPISTRFTEETEALTAALRANPDHLPDMSGFIRTALYFSGLTIVAGLISVVAVTASIQLIVLAATGRPVSVPAAFRAGIRRAPAVIGWSFLASFVYIGAFIACFLPVIYVAAALMVLPVVVTLERGTGIGRSFSLFHADLGTSVSRIATMIGLGVVSGLAVSFAGTAVQAAIGGTAGLAISIVLNGLASLAIGILSTPMLVTTYADMRARREPFSTAYLATPA